MKTLTRSHSRKPLKPSQRKTHFTLRTRLVKSIGKSNSRYPIDCVRVLPAPKRNHVVLQATDGKQAVCLVSPGQIDKPELIPGSVLPTRQSNHPLEIARDRDDWCSTDGKIARACDGDQTFPPIGEVLPSVNGKSMALGIDLSLLSKVADSFGTSQLTLMIGNPQPGAKYITQPVAVCPANKSNDVHGVAVVMPLQPEQTSDYYTKVRRDVLAAEKRSAK